MYQRSIKELELQIMFFEVPYELASTRIKWYEQRIAELCLENKTKHK